MKPIPASLYPPLHYLSPLRLFVAAISGSAVHHHPDHRGRGRGEDSTPPERPVEATSLPTTQGFPGSFSRDTLSKIAPPL